jgi:hypothetical protein
MKRKIYAATLTKDMRFIFLMQKMMQDRSLEI